MAGDYDPRSARPSGRRMSAQPAVSWVVVAVALVVTGVVAAVFLRRSPHRTPTAAPIATHNSFHVDFPKDWKRIRPPASPKSAGPAVGALRQVQGQGAIVFHRAGAAAPFNQKFVDSIELQLRRTTPDFKPDQAQLLHLHDGTAFFFSYTRTKKKTLTTITVIPDGTQSFIIDTVSPSGSKKIAKEIGNIIRSFRLVQGVARPRAFPELAP